MNKRNPGQAGASERLHELLTKNGYPLRRGRTLKFANDFGFPRSTVAPWLNGDTLPQKHSDIERIAEALGSTADWWAFGIEEPDKKQEKSEGQEAKGEQKNKVEDSEDYISVRPGEVAIITCVHEIVVFLRDEFQLHPKYVPNKVLVEEYPPLHDYYLKHGEFTRELLREVAVRVLAQSVKIMGSKLDQLGAL